MTPGGRFSRGVSASAREHSGNHQSTEQVSARARRLDGGRPACRAPVTVSPPLHCLSLRSRLHFSLHPFFLTGKHWASPSPHASAVSRAHALARSRTRSLPLPLSPSLSLYMTNHIAHFELSLLLHVNVMVPASGIQHRLAGCVLLASRPLLLICLRAYPTHLL